jgi:hypothetical protein
MTTIYDIESQQYLELGGRKSISIEAASPFLIAEGSITLPLDLPYTKKNLKALGQPDRIEFVKKIKSRRKVLVQNKTYQKHGELTIIEVDPTKKLIKVSVVFDQSTLFREAHITTLQQVFESITITKTLPEWGTHLERVMRGQDITDYSIFEVLVKDPLNSNRLSLLNELLDPTVEEVKVYFPTLKHKQALGLWAVVNNEPVWITTLAGHNITPFLKLDYVLNQIFTFFGYTLDTSLLQANPHYSDLTVLNNCADAIVTGTLLFSNLVPTCTAAAFLKSVATLLGCGFSIKGTDVKVIQWEDCLEEKPDRKPKDYSPWLASKPVVTHIDPNSIEFSAKSLSHSGEFKILPAINPVVLDLAQLGDGFNYPVGERVQFQTPRDGLLYIGKVIPNTHMELEQCLISAPTGVPLLYNNAIDWSKYLIVNELSVTNKKFLSVRKAPFQVQMPSDYKFGNFPESQKFSSDHICPTDINQGLFYDPWEYEGTGKTDFAKSYVGDIRRVNSRAIIEEDPLHEINNDCPIVFSFANKGVYDSQIQGTQNVAFVVAYFGASTHKVLTPPESPELEVWNVDEMDLRFEGSFGIHRKFYSKYSEILANSCIELSAPLNLPIHEIDSYTMDEPSILEGQSVLPILLKYEFKDNATKVIEARFRIIKVYQNQIDEGLLNQQIINQ